MPEKLRCYDRLLQDHFTRYRQMALLSGPRQVGKTTTCRMVGAHYLNWDNADDRRVILQGPAAVADRLALDRLQAVAPIVVFDELHKNSRWKAFLKG